MVQHFTLNRTPVCARFMKVVSAGEESGRDRASITSSAAVCYMQYVPREKGSGQCLDPLSSGYTEITGTGLYGSLSPARSQPGACLLQKAA